MICEVYGLNHFKHYKYVVIIGKYRGKLVLCKHRERDTWETPGGRIEPGESPLDAATRELFEETGAISFNIQPIFDYWAADHIGEASGMVFYAEIKELNDLPESEIGAVKFFEELPDKLTYRDIINKLLNHFEHNFAHLA